jgi:hypothetical protein
MSTFQNLPNNFIVETLHECCILYNEKVVLCWNDYYYYVIGVIRSVINELNTCGNSFKINIIVNCTSHITDKYNFTNNNKTVRVFIYEEHTIISQGAYNYDEYGSYTKIIYQNNSDNIELFKTIIVREGIINNSDIIINYSSVNQMNFKISMDFKDVYKKMAVINPLIYPYYNEIGNRTIHCLTTFLYPERPQKRIDFLNKIRENGINHVNINTCNSTGDFINLYRNTKILINIHQTFFYHTIEELRILPALMCGVIVICEEGPLKEYIPYHDYIVWTTNDNMIQTIRDVEQNYESLHNKFFAGSRLSNLLEIMAESNKHELYDKIISKI